jgi:GrpB-like predicted nucleotidyltransferase (UPF0157 family)
MVEVGAAIELSEYDPAWPERFRVLAERVRGLVAKPIIDFDVVVWPTDVQLAIERLASLGYGGLSRRGSRDSLRCGVSSRPARQGSPSPLLLFRPAEQARLGR